MDYEKIWESVLEIVKEIIPKISFETWLLPLKIRKIDDYKKTIVLENKTEIPIREILDIDIP